METSPEVLLDKLKRGGPGLPHLFAFCGEESYFRSKLLTALGEAVFQGVAPEDREIYRFERDTDLAAVSQAVNSYPFFCGRSLVIISDDKLFEQRKNAGDDSLAKRLEPLTKLMADVPDYCTLVLAVTKLSRSLKLYKIIKEQGVACACEPVRPSYLASWLKATAAAQGGSFAADGISRIIEFLAPVDAAPLGLLENEISKLALFNGITKPWTGADVDRVFSDLPELGAFKLADAVGKGNLIAALKYLKMETLRKKADPVPVLAMLQAKLRLMIRVLEYKNAGKTQREMEDAFTDLKNPGWQIKAALENLRYHKMPRLTDAYQKLAALNAETRVQGYTKEQNFRRLEAILVELLAD